MKWFQDFNKKDEKTSQRYWLSVNHYPNKFNDKVIFKPFFWLLLGFTFSLGILLFYFISLLSSAGKVSVVFIGAGYEVNTNISSNYEGKRILGVISDWMTNYSFMGITQVGPLLTPTSDSVFVFPEINPKSKVAIVMISMALDTDEKGLFLLKNDANPRDEEKGKIRFETIIGEMGKLPEKMHKFVILSPVYNKNTLGKAGLDFFLNNEVENEKIQAIPNLNVIIANTNKENLFEDEVFGIKKFWNKTITLLLGSDEFKHTSTYFERIGALDSRLNVTSESIKNEMYWFPIKKEGEARANKAFLTIPKIYSKPNFENQFFVNDYNSLLKEVWSTYTELKKEGTSPVVYAPELWREYEKTCIRLEVLKKRGADIEAKQLSLEMKKIEIKIAEIRKLNLQSESNGFQYMWMEGVPGEEDMIANSIFKNLDKEKAGSIKVHFDNLKKKGLPEYSQRRIAFFLAQQILEAAILSPYINTESNFDDVLNLLYPNSFYPNEIQTGQIFHPKNKKNVKVIENPSAVIEFENIIKLKIKSEKAAFGLGVNRKNHPYSEKIWPYISKIITKADSVKSLSQDYSFSASKDDLDLHRDLQVQAELLYNHATETAKTIQLAFNMRDNLASDLPWLTHWVILANPVNNSDFEDSPYDWGLEIKKLWEKYHKLNNFLVSLPTPQINSKNELNLSFEFEFQKQQLVELSNLVDQAASIASTIKKNLNNLALRALEEQSVRSWLLIKNLLNTPFFDIELRSKLLGHQLKTEKFFTNKIQEFVEDESDKGNDLEITNYKKSLVHIDFWMASFGKGIRQYNLDQTKNLNLVSESYEKLRLASTKNDILDIIKSAKLQISKCLYSDEDLVANVVDYIESNSPADFQKQVPISYLSLKESDSIARTFPWFSFDKKFNKPSISLILKHSEIRDFLCWQALRTWSDHLYSVEENKDPYYLILVNNILLDIKKFRGPTNIFETLKNVSNRSFFNVLKFKKDLELVSGLNGEIPWTFEKNRSIEISTSFQNDNNILSGKVAVGVRVSDNLVVLDKEWNFLSPRLVDAQNFKDNPSSVVLNLGRRNTLSNTSEKELGMVNFQCFFRGKFFHLDIPIEIRNQADIINQELASLNNGNVSFRTSTSLAQVANGIGSISFVLDCSGSMGPSEDSSIEESKYFQAVTALDQVLRKIPKGIKVSVWIFGQAVGGGKTVLDPENNIVQIIKPFTWDPDNLGVRKNLISKLRYPLVEPWNASPIIRAMSLALNDLTKTDGPKMMVVLTDGLDNRIKKDKILNPDSKNADAVLFSLLNLKNVQVQVVGFRAVPEEEEEMRSQFSIIETIDPPGNFVSVKSLDALIARINRFLSPSASVRIEDLNNFKPDGLENKTLEISKFGSGDRWIPGGLKPGFYNSKLNDYPAISKDIKIEHNDRLLIGLVKSDSNLPFQFKRLLISETDFIGRPSIEKQNWRSSILANKLLNNNCKLFTVLEKKYDSREVLISQIKPKEVWWELKTNNKKFIIPKFKVTKFNDFPAQAWSIESLNWPTDLLINDQPAPVVSLWWNSDQETSFISKLDKGIDFNSWGDLEGKKIQIEGKTVMVSSCSIQPLNLLNKNGFMESQNAMVLTIIHPSNMSLMVKLEGLNNLSKETHWFKGSGQTVLVLGPVELTAPLPSSIVISSVDQMKKNAESRGMFLEFSDLPKPDINDVFPVPILNQP
jgi:hypothetical protein